VPELSEVAQRNIKLLQAKTPVEVLTADVMQVNLDQGTIYFFFDPFGAETLSGVLKKIQASLFTIPRKVRIICFHPGPRKSLFDECDWLSLSYRYKDRIFIYQTS